MNEMELRRRRDSPAERSSRMFSISSHTARVAVTAGLVSALTLGGGSITALAEVAKADAPAAAAPAASTDQTSVAVPAESQAVTPAAEVPEGKAVASVTRPKDQGGATKYYDSLSDALANATGSNTVAERGDEVKLLKDSNEDVTVSKRIVVTAVDNATYRGTMTVAEGALIKGIHFAIDDNSPSDIVSSITVEGNSTDGAAIIQDNTFNITPTSSTSNNYASITIQNGAERTKVQNNEFNLSSRPGDDSWYGIVVKGSPSSAINGVVVTNNTVKISGDGSITGDPTGVFLKAESSSEGYGVTNLSVTNNNVYGSSYGSQGIVIRGVNGLEITGNVLTGLYSALMPETITGYKNDNIVVGNNALGSVFSSDTGTSTSPTLYDIYVTDSAHAQAVLGDAGIVREAPERYNSKTTFFPVGLENRSVTFSGHNRPGARLYHSVQDAVNAAADGQKESVFLYENGNSTESVTIGGNKDIVIAGIGSIRPKSGPALIVDKDSVVTIMGGYYYGTIKSNYKNNDMLNIEAGYFIDEPDAAWVANGRGFKRVDKNGDKMWTVGDAELESGDDVKDGKVDVDVEKTKIDDEGAFENQLIGQAAKVNVKGYTIDVNDETSKRALEAIVAAVKSKTFNTTYTVTYKAIKASTGASLKDGADDATVTVTYNLKSSKTQDPDGLVGKATEALKNTTDKPDQVVKDLENAKTDAEDALKESPTTQEAIDNALDKLKEALDAFNTADLEKAETSALEQKIKDANDALKQYPNKTDEAKKELNEAIKKAQSIVDSKPNKSDQSNVDQAVTDLQAAIDMYINSANKPTGGNGGNGGGTVTPTPKTYTVTFVDNVSYTTDQTAKVTSGQKVTKPADPTLEGYVFKGWFTDAGLKQAYDFSKPVTGDLTLFAKWAYPVTAPKTFADVDQSAWYVPGINFVTSHGLMHGYGDGTYFGVGKQLTRGELASILMNFAAPGYGPEDFRDAKNETDLPDIADGQFYTAAANWAVKNGVINGYGNPDGSRTFGPNDPVTMEQLVAILANLADKEGPDKADTAVLAKFEDPASVSPWATKSVAWAVERGLIHGSGENGGLYLHGSANIMRERVATIFMNAFDEGILSFE